MNDSNTTKNGIETESFYLTVHILNHYEVGALHLLIVTFFIINQLLFFNSFYRLRRTLNTMPFKIIIHHGIVSFIAQICHFVTAIRTIINCLQPDITNRFTGSVINSTYISGVALIFLLTLNRCDIMFNEQLIPRLIRRKFYQYGIVACYIFACILCIFFSIPIYNLSFEGEYYEWVYDSTEYYSQVAFQVQNTSVLTFLALSTVLYVIMFLKLLQLRSYTTKKKVLEFTDIKFVIHALLCFASVAILEFSWSGILKNIYSNEITSLIPELLFIFVSGCNTIVTFCFVKEIRNDVISFVSCGCKRNRKIKDLVKTNITKV
uniref:7TM_GPCR_Srx domain-containing protein n=1 Tax=Parastrongyloides trichosuri TaxID=131310 RepID=A0A0N5A6C3_PARTI